MHRIKSRKSELMMSWRLWRTSVLLLTICLLAPMLASAGTEGTDFKDKIQSTQRIPNPGAMEGRLNADDSTGSIDDYYHVTLSGGESIILSMDSDSGTNKSAIDMDLYMLDSSGKVVASSVGEGESEIISNVAFSGEYILNVHAENGSSGYSLEVGDVLPEIDSGVLSSSWEFVPGEVIVRFSDQSVGSTSSKDMEAHVSSMGMGVKSGKPGKEFLASMNMDKKESMFQSLGISEDRAAMTAVDTETQEKMDTLLVVKALRKRSDVISADPNYIVHPVAVPDDTYYESYQWNLQLIDLENTWDITTGSGSVVVAVVDTGVLTSHPDLADKLTDDGYDFISDTSISNDGDGIDDDPDDPGDSTTAGEASFHGTHVSGIVGAESNNSLGVAGIGWSTMIMPVRVLGIDGGTEYDVLQGVRYAAGLSNDSGTVPDQVADIINLSLGSDNYSSSEESVYEEVREAGVIVVAAAGNDSSANPLYPAAYGSVISVAAVGPDGDRASYSNYGAYVDIAAPGGDIYGGTSDYVLSTGGDLTSSGAIDLGYVWMAGTSMASPHVAGVAALMKAIDSDMTPDDFEDYILSGDITDDIDDTPLYSYGMINAYKAVVAVGGSSDDDEDDDDDTGTLSVSPTSLDFGTNDTEFTLTVSNSGDGDVSVTDVTDDALWLTVSESSVDEDGMGTYTAAVSRSDLSEGSYSATITFSSDSNTETVAVSMIVESDVEDPGDGDPGGGGGPGGPGGGGPGGRSGGGR